MKYRIITDESTKTYDEKDQAAMFKYVESLMSQGVELNIKYEYTWQEIASTQ
jgi:ABC-type sugar transport system ATPase subunit